MQMNMDFFFEGYKLVTDCYFAGVFTESGYCLGMHLKTACGEFLKAK